MQGSPALDSPLWKRLEGAFGGLLLMLFIGVSFDLPVVWLLLVAGIGAAGGSVLALKGAEVHPPQEPLQLLPRAPPAVAEAGQPDTTARGPGMAFVYLVQSAYLIGSFLWRTLTPAYEWEARLARITTIGLDILVIAGLLAVRKRMPHPLFWIALAAGIGLLAIRLTGNGWHTGHLDYTLAPR
jgi:hypothetical protein